MTPVRRPPKTKMSIGTPSGFSQSGQMTGHWRAGAVKRELAWAAGSLLAGVQSRPFQSMAWLGGAPSIPSHQMSPSSVRAQLVKMVFSFRVVHRGRVGFVGGAGGDPEEAAFGVDGIGSAVGTDLDPGDVVADASRISSRGWSA